MKIFRLLCIWGAISIFSYTDLHPGYEITETDILQDIPYKAYFLTIWKTEEDD